MSEKIFVIPPQNRYLSEIAESNRKYDETALSQQQVAQNYGFSKL
jgi:methylmalonyl-CoA mutase